MADFFNSKEIYKRIPKIKPEENPLRAVRGVYISGEWRPIYWIDETIHLSQISTTKANVDTMSTAYGDTYDHIMNVETINFPEEIDIIDYSRAYDISYDTIMNVVSIEHDEIEIYEYGRSYSDTYDHIMNVETINFPEEIDIIDYSHEIYDNTYDPIINVTTIMTVKATIENYVEPINDENIS